MTHDRPIVASGFRIGTFAWAGMDIRPNSVLHVARTAAAPLGCRRVAMGEWTAIAAMKASFPKAFPGMRIGLLGGSFDPAHDGHAHLTREALKRLGLDQVWWLVSPGNPLKSDPPAPIADRMARARAVMAHPRVVITDIEARFATRYTAKTLEKLLAHYPGVRFVWLMGADNLAQFHRWQKWDWIITHVPIAVFARPGTRLAARGGRAAEEYARFRVPAEAARLVAGMQAPAWCFLDMPLNDLSSSAIRANGDWRGGKWRG